MIDGPTPEERAAHFGPGGPVEADSNFWRLGFGDPRGLLAFSLVLQRGEEEGLVDPSLKDRYSHLHALRDDLAAVHARLSGQLRGRQVIRQSILPSGVSKSNRSSRGIVLSPYTGFGRRVKRWSSPVAGTAILD